MYDAGLTGLIMIPLAVLLSILLAEPGELGILPGVLVLTSGWTEQAPSREIAVRVSLLCYSAWPDLAGLLWRYMWATATTSWGTVKHLPPFFNPQRKEKQVQSSTGLTHSRCHKESPRTFIQSVAFSKATLSNQ